ncbi:MAG TPA: CDP-alcohol phosphatidyltransferase family protein [Sphingobacteriaceae bacterium]
MHKKSYYIINAITAYRLIAAPFLLILILNDNVEIFRWLLAFSFFTDAIDGFLARKYKTVSRFGARLDSIGDDLTVVVGLIGLITVQKDFVLDHLYLLIILFCLFAVQAFLAIRKYGKTTSFHTYLAKTAAVVQGVFLILSFFFPEPLYLLFYLAIGITMIELVEEIILVLILPHWKINVKGIYWVMKSKGKVGSTEK